MISHTTPAFRKLYADLPPQIRTLARKQYRLWKDNPAHPSLEFKKVGHRIWSARINISWRVMATPIPGGYLWYWVGPHDEYLRAIRSH